MYGQPITTRVSFSLANGNADLDLLGVKPGVARGTNFLIVFTVTY